jgi:hypothetical protein
MFNGIVGTAEAGRGTGEHPPAAGRSRPWWSPWLIALVLAALAGGVIGAAVEHARDQDQAAGDQYRAQVLSTLTRFLDAEHQLLGQPAAHRDASVLGDLADSITGDTGINGAGTLSVDVGTGSAAQPHQAIFTVTVGSPHGTTAFAVWFLEPQGPSTSEEGACVLSSTLLGSGRATRDLVLGGGSAVEGPCPATFWSASSDPAQPRFDLAGIPRQPPV